MKFIISLLLLTLSHQSFAAETLDELLTDVKNRAMQEGALWKKRESEFRAKRDNQATLLRNANQELADLEAEGRRLAGIFDANEKKLAIMKEELNIAVGTLGEVFGVVRQVSGDFKGVVESSVVSTQFPGRAEFLDSLTDKKAIPSSAELERFWFELQREMTESGKVVSYKAPVVGSDGKTKEMEVLRIGSFNIATDGDFLNYTPETGTISYLARQPSMTGQLSKLQSADEGFAGAVAIDPTRGALLNMLIEAPTLWERFTYGGIVGYVIVIVLLFGLALAVERFMFLSKEETKIKEQMSSKEANEDNALGRIWKAFGDFRNMDKDRIELKLDEELIKNSAPFEKRLGLIKLFAAIAPLMGLLGTVTGMIMTFQSITLFGTGNPAIMAGGISQALVTTVLGLVCAIPLLLIHNFLNDKAQGILTILEEQSLGLLSEKLNNKSNA
jgi:biopolymer transport protein ExbB